MIRIAENTPGCALCPARRLCGARDLDPEALERLTDCVSTSVPLRRGEILYRAGDPSEGWYVVRSGVVRTTMPTADGDEHVTGFHFAGELIGIEGDADGGHEETATVLASATVCRIPAAQVEALLAIGAGSALRRLIAERDRTTRAVQINLRHARADARIAGFLRRLMAAAERQGFDSRRVHAPMSRTDMANHLGLTLECVSRVLGRWRRAGLIETDREHITIPDPAALDERAENRAA